MIVNKNVNIKFVVKLFATLRKVHLTKKGVLFGTHLAKQPRPQGFFSLQKLGKNKKRQEALGTRLSAKLRADSINR